MSKQKEKETDAEIGTDPHSRLKVLVMTDACPECGGTGIRTRYVSGSRTTGHYLLRYTPNPPVACKCVSTS